MAAQGQWGIRAQADYRKLLAITAACQAVHPMGRRHWSRCRNSGPIAGSTDRRISEVCVSRAVYADPLMSFKYARALLWRQFSDRRGTGSGIQPTIQGLEGVTFSSESATKTFDPFPPTAFAR